MIPEVYINPAIVIMIIGIVTLLITVGGTLWRFAGSLSDIKSDVRVLNVNLQNHIEFCEKNAGHKVPVRAGQQSR
mgnify:CR=1 FL=1